MKKKVRIVILIAILILLVLIINSTYSKYANRANAVIAENIGKWIIKINDTDITTTDENGNAGVFEISDFTWNWDDTPNVKPPKVAPGMHGYFNLKIDPTGTDVSIKYTITIDDAKIAESTGITTEDGEDISDRINLKITGITENGVALELPRDDDGNIIISKVKKLEKIQSTNEADRIDDLQIEVTWENNEDNNDIDSQLGAIANNTIKLPIKVNVIQWTGEDGN